MSWLSKSLGKVGKWAGDRWGDGPSVSGLKSSVKGTGNFVKTVAPYAAGAALLPGVGGALAGMAGGALSKIPGAGAVLGGGADGKGNFGKLGDLAGKIPGVGKLAGSLSGGSDGFGLDDLLQLGLGGMSAYEGIKSNNEANALRRDAMEMAKGDYASRGQFRDAAVPMLQAQRPDLSSTFGGYSNVYSKKKIPSVGGNL